MKVINKIEEFLELYSRFIESGEKLTTLTVFEDKGIGEFIHQVRSGKIKTNDDERKKLLELGLLTEEHILKLKGDLPRKSIRKQGTAAKETIILVKEISKFVDITNLPYEVKISELLTPEQIKKVQKKTGFEIDSSLDIKREINYLKFGGIHTTDKQRQELKKIGIMEDKHIKKLEGKISKNKKNKRDKSNVKKDDSEKRKMSPRNSVPEKIMQILNYLYEKGVNVANIRQSDTLKNIISKKRLENLKKITGIEDISLDFRIGMYISNIRQGHIKTDAEQRGILNKLDVLNAEHIFKLEKREKLSIELKDALSEIEAIDIEEEEIKNELAKIKAREKELKERLKDVEERKDNAQKNLQELNSKGVQNKSR